MKYILVDAFAETLFTGSPTGVCVVQGPGWPEKGLLQSMAAENGLPETAFVMKQKGGYGLRWFAPNAEVDLCGHATLATAYVVSRYLEPEGDVFRFDTESGPLFVEKKGDLFEMDFPSRVPVKTPLTGAMVDALGGTAPVESYQSRDYFFLLESEQQVRDLQPDFAKMAALDYGDGVIVTAKGSKSDFVTRAFFPKLLTNEDPVCGSAHCNLIPFWAQRLSKLEMVSHQLSPRGAVVYCRHMGERVKIAGKVALYGEGEILI